MRDRESELRAVGWLSGTALALILVMAIVCGCSSQKSLHTESTASMHSVDSSVINGKSGKYYDGWWWLSARLDTLHISIRADSIVTPDGSRVHNPYIDVRADRPTYEAAGVEEMVESYSIHTESEQAIYSRTDDRTDEEAAAEAPGKGWLMWLGYAAAFLLPFMAVLIFHKIRGYVPPTPPK